MVSNDELVRRIVQMFEAKESVARDRFIRYRKYEYQVEADNYREAKFIALAELDRAAKEAGHG